MTIEGLITVWWFAVCARARVSMRDARSLRTVLRHRESPRYATLPGMSVSRLPPSARPCKGPSTYDSGMKAIGSTHNLLHTLSHSRASVTPLDRGRRVLHPSFEYNAAENVHAKFAPSKMTEDGDDVRAAGASSSCAEVGTAAADDFFPIFDFDFPRLPAPPRRDTTQ